VIYCIESEGEASLSKKVGEVMTAPAITVAPNTQVDEALELMTRRRIRHLPVVQDGAMCGFVSIGDLVKTQVDSLAQEAEAMRSYIQSA
jgi:signal-transduction protein with cAMP-binding, CBS, and nucleotidyltransferase domain